MQRKGPESLNQCMSVDLVNLYLIILFYADQQQWQLSSRTCLNTSDKILHDNETLRTTVKVILCHQYFANDKHCIMPHCFESKGYAH